MNWLKILFSGSNEEISDSQSIGQEDSLIELPLINPATGLNMIDGIGGVDVGGDTFGSSSMMDSGFDDFSSSFNSYDDY